MCVCVCLCKCTCLYACLYVHVCTYIYVCVYVHMYVCMTICKYDLSVENKKGHCGEISLLKLVKKKHFSPK